MPEQKKQASSGMLRVRVSPTAETTVRNGHPWVFSNSVRDQNREGKTGELAVVYDRKDRFLAIGLWDCDSPIRLRILHCGKPLSLDQGWWQQRLEQALARREGLFDQQTTGYRWINGESDGWPGLVLDRYADTLVLKLYTAAWLPRLEELAELIWQRLKPGRLVLRLSRNSKSTCEPGAEVRVLKGAPVEGPVVFMESGLRFEAEVLRGQKTGFFLDQRENRRMAGKLAAGRTVLNTFSFSGAFSVYAAAGGARNVLDLDISPHALASAQRNFELNRELPGVSACSHELVQADAFEWLSSSERLFDLVILDPPSMAKREAERARALQAYERLATLGLKRLTRGGILLACSCSAHVSAEEFFQSMRKVVRQRAGMSEFQTALEPPDHPADIPEAHYLKAIYFRQSGAA